MATTTNYGWTTPDDTALVKDGASAIRSLGTSVDTTTKNLNPSTTLGDIEYRSSTANVNTRLPLGTAGQVLKVNSGATAPEWATDASGMTNPMTTTGDTIYSSSGSTPARLAIGSTGNVLTVAGGVPTWAAPAGGLTSAASVINTGESTSSSVFVDLTTNQTVSLTTGTKALVFITAKMLGNSTGDAGWLGFAVSGATTVAATDARAVQNDVDKTNVYNTYSGSFFISGLTAGSNTFTLKLRSNAGTQSVKDRQLIVIDLGS
jgi:hypothetical protein